MDIDGSRILVTGGAGLVGSHVIDQLIAENPKDIICFDKNPCWSRSLEIDYGKVKVIGGDLRSVDDIAEALKGIDFVFHTAALLTRESNEDLRSALGVNICGTFNLLEASIASGVKKIIYSSSVSIYGDPLINPVREEHGFNVVSMYGACKASGELMLKVFKRLKGLDYVALRYASVYGPRNHYRADVNRCIPETFDRIERGLPPVIYGDGSQAYEFVYVEEIKKGVDIYIKLIQDLSF